MVMEMNRITLHDLDKKLDLLLQEMGYMKAEQKRGADELENHTILDTSRFDGTPSTPGLMIKVDRLYQDSEKRRKAVDRQKAWLYSLTAGFLLSLLPGLLGWLGH